MKIFSKINKFILDSFFPIQCLGCQKEGFWICDVCLSKIILKDEHVCGVCEKRITPDGRTCLDCKRKSPLDALITATSYNESCISKAVHLFKYRFVQDLHIELGNLLIASLRKTDLPLPDLIIPIPLHTRRLRWRGFNQSLLLANQIAKNLLPESELTVNKNLLSRHRYTSPQMEIKNYQGRKENIIGAFSITQPTQIKNKTILLIDDITTTGSTLFECAKILKKAGAAEVHAAVIARQEIEK